MFARRIAPLAAAAVLSCSSAETGGPGVTAEIDALTVSVDLESPAAGEVVTATAKGHFSDGTEKDVSETITWRSSDEATLERVAGAANKFRSRKMGQAQILAASGDVTASARITVGVAKVASLEIIPNQGDIGIGGSLRVNVIADYTDDTRINVTKRVTWTTSDGNVLVASDTDRGYLVTFGQGSARISAQLEGKEISGDYTVGPAKIDYITVTPRDARIDQMMPLQYHAMGHWTDRRTLVEVTNMVTWSSSDTGVARIDASGLATAVGDGNTVITAKIGDVEGSVLARTVTTMCPYPNNPATEVAFDTVMPPLFWLDAIDDTGRVADFRLEDRFCSASPTSSSILFVVTAAWCPHCPEYMQRVDSLSAELEAAGMQVVYVVIETSDGRPADNMQANRTVDQKIMKTGHSIRVGDGKTSGAVATPFSRAVTSVPNAFVVRTSDMRVIAFQGRSNNVLDFAAIARNPNRLW